MGSSQPVVEPLHCPCGQLGGSGNLAPWSLVTARSAPASTRRAPQTHPSGRAGRTPRSPRRRSPLFDHDPDREWITRGKCNQLSRSLDDDLVARKQLVDLFFPRRGHGVDPMAAPRLIAKARDICGVCAVRPECLAYAMKHYQDGRSQGFWGGMTGKERRDLWREMRRKRIMVSEPEAILSYVLGVLYPTTPE